MNILTLNALFMECEQAVGSKTNHLDNWTVIMNVATKVAVSRFYTCSA